MRNRGYLYAVAVYTAHSWELYGIRNWILAFLLTVPAVTATDDPALWAGLLAGIMMTVGGAGNVLSVWATDTIARSTAIGVSLGSSATITVALVFLQRCSMASLVALLVVYGITLTGDSSPTSTVITELVDDETVGTALAIQSLGGFAATATSPVVFGLVLDRSGCLAAFLTLFIVFPARLTTSHFRIRAVRVMRDATVSTATLTSRSNPKSTTRANRRVVRLQLACGFGEVDNALCLRD